MSAMSELDLSVQEIVPSIINENVKKAYKLLQEGRQYLQNAIKTGTTKQVDECKASTKMDFARFLDAFVAAVSASQLKKELIAERIARKNLQEKQDEWGQALAQAREKSDRIAEGYTNVRLILGCLRYRPFDEVYGEWRERSPRALQKARDLFDQENKIGRGGLDAALRNYDTLNASNEVFLNGVFNLLDPALSEFDKADILHALRTVRL